MGEFSCLSCQKTQCPLGRRHGNSNRQYAVDDDVDEPSMNEFRYVII